MLADLSGRTKQRSACHPRSDICCIPAAIPPRIFSASNPGGNAGSEKSTVSGSWPTNNTRFIIESPLITIFRWQAHHVPVSAMYLAAQRLPSAAAVHRGFRAHDGVEAVGCMAQLERRLHALRFDHRKRCGTGKEPDQVLRGVPIPRACTDTAREGDVRLNFGRQRANEFDSGCSENLSNNDHAQLDIAFRD